MESPNVVTFTPDGSRIFAAGFKTDRMIQVFDTAIPGRDATTLRLGKTRRSKDGQKGIVSALAFPNGNNMLCGTGKSNVFAVGAYSPGSIYIYDDRRPSGDPAGTILHGGMCIVGHGKSFTRKKRRFVDISAGNNEIGVENEDRQGEDINDLFSMAKVNWYQSRARGGITQLQWSTGSDFFLYSASRRSDAVLAWDMRVLTGSDSHPIRGIMSFPRESDTNQRLEFDLNEDGTNLFTASKDKCVKIYDAKNGTLLKRIDGFDDVVNGVSFKTDTTGKGLLAVAAGARRFTEVYDNEEDNGETMSKSALCDDGDQRRTSHDPPGSLSLYQL
jgi:WD40 repeat protein